MTKNKKYTTAEKMVAIFCGLGCLLMVVPKFVDTEFNLFSIAIFLNGIGIMAFLYSQGSMKAK